MPPTLATIRLLPYALNLNVTERFWPFFNNTVPYACYSEPFVPFEAACDSLCAGLEH